MLMGLRLTESVELARIEARSGLPRDEFVDAGAAARLAGQGLVVAGGDRLAVTDAGILLLGRILSEVGRTGHAAPKSVRPEPADRPPSLIRGRSAESRGGKEGGST